MKELRQKRAAVLEKLSALAEKDFKAFTPEDQTQFDALRAEADELLKAIERKKKALELSASNAEPVEGQTEPVKKTVPATLKDNPWENEDHAKARFGTSKGLIFAGVAKMIGAGHGSPYTARDIAKDVYGENHPVTKALLAGTATAGGFMVPPDYVNEIIELLRPMTVVRASNPRVLPMPRGTMRLPSQTSPATASYGAEDVKIPVSQQKVGAIVASFKKLTAMVPISNDLMRYADPAADAFVRDDLVKVIALREDLAFLTGDGTQDTPRGYLSFANGFASGGGGTAGTWLSTGNSTLASGGQFITSNATYTLSTAAQELGGAVNRLDTQNVADTRRVWLMHPRSFNYLNNVQNSLGVYVYRDELSRGTLLQYPFRKTTQIPINIWDATGTNKDLSFIFLSEMTDSIIFDSMSLELAVSREGTYVDANSNTQSVFANDETLIRAITEHDFQMRHDQAVAIIQGVRWAPAIS